MYKGRSRSNFKPRRTSRPKSAAKTKTKVSGYTLRGKNGRITYVGVTNNPKRRAEEHRKSGKTGTLKVERQHNSRSDALKWERNKLGTYRRYHEGKNPPLNKTRNGGWKY